MKIGDEVEWTSQSLSFSTTKRGRIIAIVPPGEEAHKYGYKPNGGPAGVARNHESYIVSVGTKKYWPRVKHLTLRNARDK